MNEMQRKVLEFYERADLNPAKRPLTMPSEKLRELAVNLISEELHELNEAFGKRNIIDVADAIADVLYTAFGAAVVCGLDMEPIFDLVHQANMKKIGGPKNFTGKQLKPDGWKPADLEAELERQVKIVRGREPVVSTLSLFHILAVPGTKACTVETKVELREGIFYIEKLFAGQGAGICKTDNETVALIILANSILGAPTSLYDIMEECGEQVWLEYDKQKLIFDIESETWRYVGPNGGLSVVSYTSPEMALARLLPAERKG